MLELLGGTTHVVVTGVAVIRRAANLVRRCRVTSAVHMRPLTSAEVEAYVASGEWQGKAGGYAIQGLAGAFIVKLVGSYTNVVGLPLYETMSLLDGEGFPVRFGWLNAA